MTAQVKKTKQIIYDINHNYAKQFKELCDGINTPQAEILRGLIKDYVKNVDTFIFSTGGGKKSIYDKKTTFLLDIETAEELKQIAKEKEDSVSKIVRNLVRHYINEKNKEIETDENR